MRGPWQSRDRHGGAAILALASLPVGALVPEGPDSRFVSCDPPHGAMGKMSASFSTQQA